jgi:hypothetical protein
VFSLFLALFLPCVTVCQSFPYMANTGKLWL